MCSSDLLLLTSQTCTDKYFSEEFLFFSASVYIIVYIMSKVRDKKEKMRNPRIEKPTELPNPLSDKKPPQVFFSLRHTQLMINHDFPELPRKLLSVIILELISGYT